MIMLIDTFDELIDLRHAMSVRRRGTKELWLEYIEPYPELESMCESDAQTSGYDFDTDVEPILKSALTSSFPKVVESHESILSCLSSVQQKFESAFRIREDIRVVFYAGLCNGAGWAVKYGNSHAVLLGVEKIVELGWQGEETIRTLLYHELCHVAHSILRNECLEQDWTDPSTKTIWHLYVEGFAQRYEQLLAGYDCYHQDEHGWLQWCKDNITLIRTEYLHRLEGGGSVKDFFGDWNSFHGYSDVGYFLGCQFIKSLQKDMDVDRISKLDLMELKGLAISYLQNQ